MFIQLLSKQRIILLLMLIRYEGIYNYFDKNNPNTYY